MAAVGSLRAWLSVDSEAVEAGVLRVAPVRQHPHLNDLEGLVVLFLRRRRRRRGNVQCMLLVVTLNLHLSKELLVSVCVLGFV